MKFLQIIAAAIVLAVSTVSNFAQQAEPYNVNAVEFEIVGKSAQVEALGDAFRANAISNLNSFEEVFNAGVKNKLIRVLFAKSQAVKNEQVNVLAAEKNLDLINSKKRKIGEVPSFSFQIYPHLLEGDGVNKLVYTEMNFVRNVADKTLKPSEVAVPVITTSYRTVITNAFNQVTTQGGSRSPKGNQRFLAIYYTK